MGGRVMLCVLLLATACGDDDATREPTISTRGTTDRPSTAAEPAPTSSTTVAGSTIPESTTASTTREFAPGPEITGSARHVGTVSVSAENIPIGLLADGRLVLQAGADLRIHDLTTGTDVTLATAATPQTFWVVAASDGDEVVVVHNTFNDDGTCSTQARWLDSSGAEGGASAEYGGISIDVYVDANETFALVEQGILINHSDCDRSLPVTVLLASDGTAPTRLHEGQAPIGALDGHVIVGGGLERLLAVPLSGGAGLPVPIPESHSGAFATVAGGRLFVAQGFPVTGDLDLLRVDLSGSVERFANPTGTRFVQALYSDGDLVFAVRTEGSVVFDTGSETAFPLEVSLRASLFADIAGSFVAYSPDETAVEIYDLSALTG